MSIRRRLLALAIGGVVPLLVVGLMKPIDHRGDKEVAIRRWENEGGAILDGEIVIVDDVQNRSSPGYFPRAMCDSGHTSR